MAPDFSDVDSGKSNVLFVGPTALGRPCLRGRWHAFWTCVCISDATTLIERLCREDVENVVLRLLQAANYDVRRRNAASSTIDEIDKISRTTENVSITRDVSGEGVQQALLQDPGGHRLQCASPKRIASIPIRSTSSVNTPTSFHLRRRVCRLEPVRQEADRHGLDGLHVNPTTIYSRPRR